MLKLLLVSSDFFIQQMQMLEIYFYPLFWKSRIFVQKATLFLGFSVLDLLKISPPFSEIL